MQFSPQSHVIVDSTCEVEESGVQTSQGVGVTSNSLKSGSSNLTVTDTLQFLSNAFLQCIPAMTRMASLLLFVLLVDMLFYSVHTYH